MIPLVGCGGGAGGGGATSDDARAIGELISGLEGQSAPQAAARFFPKGATPPADRLKALARYTILTAGKPQVSGDTATARVKFVENRTGQDAGEAEWTFVKEGAAWKIKAAPLP